MFKTLKLFFDFCNKEDQNKLYLAIALGVIKAIFAALRITAIAVVVSGLVNNDMSSKQLFFICERKVRIRPIDDPLPVSNTIYFPFTFRIYSSAEIMGFSNSATVSADSCSAAAYSSPAF